jgi:hypothetical protein
MDNICDNCNTDCNIRNEYNLKNCNNFTHKSMCLVCKFKDCNGYTENPSQFFICGGFKHEKGYYVSFQ